MRRGGQTPCGVWGLWEEGLKAAFTGRGAWHMSRTGSLQSALSNSIPRQYGFFVPSDLAAQ